MCGICGFIQQRDKDRIDWKAIISKMNSLLAHRGPDSEGYFFPESRDLIIGLGHRRLSIIDISDSGNQPMPNEDESLHVVFNGEIYNYKDLTRKLEDLGHRFRSKSDTEVIVHLYEEVGERCIEELQGMFAFALWDQKRSSLLLARDRIGVKPLFYAPMQKGIVFASEIKSILAHPWVRSEMDTSAVDAYLTLGYVPGPKTIFKTIKALLPGQKVNWHGCALDAAYYWTPDFSQPPSSANEKDLIEELDSLLNETVQHHMVSDVPVGVFLSGGMDSSLVAAIAQKQNPRPLNTYTIGFTGGRDERAYAKTVARHTGSRHHEAIAEPDLTGLLPRLMWHLEQPLFDNSILPTFLVSELASKRGKVVLSGDGGDETFAGYDWTRFALILPHLPLRWDPANWPWLYERGNRGFLKRLLYDLGHSAPARYLRRLTVPAPFRHWLYTQEILSKIDGDPLHHLVEFLNKAPVRKDPERLLYCDLRAYLPEDVLFKVDRMSMAHGVEVRVPLLDHRLVEWLFRVPFSMRFRRGRGKYLLRKVAARYLPPSITKPRKQGFTVPLGDWLHGPLGEKVARLFSSKAFAGRKIARPERVLQLLDMHQSRAYDLGHRIWSLVVLEVWARIWLDGCSPDVSLGEMIGEDS